MDFSNPSGCFDHLGYVRLFTNVSDHNSLIKTIVVYSPPKSHVEHEGKIYQLLREVPALDSHYMNYDCELVSVSHV